MAKLTFDVQLHGVAVAIALLVTANARIHSASGSRNVLKHQTLIGHNYTTSHGVVQLVSLHTNETNKTIFVQTVFM